MKIYLIYNRETGRIWRHFNSFVVHRDGSIEGKLASGNSSTYSKQCKPAILRISQELLDQINGDYKKYIVLEGKVMLRDSEHLNDKEETTL